MIPCCLRTELMDVLLHVGACPAVHATLFCLILTGTPQDIPCNLNVRYPSSISCVVYLIFGDHIALPDLHFKCGLLWAHTPIHWHEVVDNRNKFTETNIKGQGVPMLQ